MAATLNQVRSTGRVKARSMKEDERSNASTRDTMTIGPPPGLGLADSFTSWCLQEAAGCDTAYMAYKPKPRSTNPLKPGKQDDKASTIYSKSNNPYSDPFTDWCLKEAAKPTKTDPHAKVVGRQAKPIARDRTSAPPDASEVPVSFLVWKLDGMPLSMSQPTGGHLCMSCQQALHIHQNFCDNCGAKNTAAADFWEGQMPKKVKILEKSSSATLSTTSAPEEYSLSDLSSTPSRQISKSSEAIKDPSAEGCTVTAYQGLPTTLMIRNIPLTYTQEALAAEWPNSGGMYDFFYVPCSANMQRNKTYAFINFTSNQAALDFKNKWDKMRLPQFATRKALSISCADVQGRDENLLQLMKKRHWRLKVKACQPLIFENGVLTSLDDAFATLEGAAKEWSL